MSVRKPHLIDRWPMPLSPFNLETAVVDGARVYLREPRRTRICIYGAGGGQHEAPLNDPTWEVMALNLVAPYDRTGALRADTWWDLHQRAAQTAEDLRWIAACPVPIYLPPDLMEASPRAVRFPLEEIEETFHVSYFACSFAYQIALILYEGVATDLGVYGVELALGTERERTVEWACVAYWLGRAQERGLRIYRPRHSMLGRHFARYGLEYQQERDDVRVYTGMMRRAKFSPDVAGSVEETPPEPSRG